MQLLESNHAPSEVIFAANLAIEENATNIIKYGYDDDLKHEIAIGLEMTENLLIIEISDGKEFNPFDRPEADILLPTKEPKIGGLGVHLVRRMLTPAHTTAVTVETPYGSVKSCAETGTPSFAVTASRGRSLGTQDRAVPVTIPKSQKIASLGIRASRDILREDEQTIDCRAGRWGNKRAASGA